MTRGDRILSQFTVLVLLPITVNLVTGWLAAQWRWLGFIVASTLAISILLTMPGGFLHPQRYGRQRVGQIAASLSLLIYLAGTGWIALAGTSWPIALVAGGGLWLMSSLLVWSTLRADRSRVTAGSGLALLMIAQAVWMHSLSQPTLTAFPGLVFGLAFMMLGLATLQWGVAPPRGTPIILVGSALALIGLVDAMWAIETGHETMNWMASAARAIRAAAFFLSGIIVIWWRLRPIVIIPLLFASGWLLEGLAGVQRDGVWEASYFLLVASGLSVASASILRWRMNRRLLRRNLHSIAGVLAAACLEWWGVTALKNDMPILGVGYLLLGSAALTGSVWTFVAARQSDWSHRLRRYLLGGNDDAPDNQNP